MLSRRSRTEENCRTACLGPAALLILAAGLTGCQFAPPSQPAIQPILAEIIDKWPEVDTSDACVVADFANPEQATAFHMIRADGQTVQASQPAILPIPDNVTERGLAFTLDQAGDALVLDLAQLASACAGRAPDYATLLAVLYSPAAGARLRVLVRDSRGNVVASTEGALSAGRNVLKVDLDALPLATAGHTPQTVRCELVGEYAPVSLLLRGFVLADRVRWAVGGPVADGFRVCQRAGRVFIAFPNGQELVLAGGIIWRWHPSAGINVGSSSGLGPLFVNPQEQGSVKLSQADQRGPGTPVAAPEEYGAWQTVVAEASRFRCVVEAKCDGQHRGMTGETQSETAAAGARRQFTIYPDGRTYMYQAHLPAQSGTAASIVHHALAVDSRAGFERSPPPPVTPNYQPAEYVHLHAQGITAGGLLWVPAEPRAAARAVWKATLGTERSLAIMPLEAPASDVALMLWFLSAPGGSTAEIEQRAADYQRPATIRVSVGRRVLDAPGDINHDGFNESEGCYELALERDRLHFVFDPAGQTRYRPVFRIEGTQEKDARVYVNGRRLRDGARDRAGRLLFALPDGLRTSRYVDVYAQP